MIVTRPPLGWNTWNTFGANISEELIMQSADAMVREGLLDAGYEYVVIDDIWALKERDKNGRLVPDPEKFPHGMKYLSDYIHSKGLKFGMYSSAGYQTCAGYPASFEYEWTDAASFAEWGVDYLKYDYCYHPTNVRPDILYKRMALALANSGRDIVFSACSWGVDNTRQWIKETGAHLWRSTGDIYDGWPNIKMLAHKEMQEMEYNGCGCFNDMDMLVVGMNGCGNVGVGGCTFEEYKTHFSFWAFMGSPLMIGCDIRNMTDETKKILTNKEVLRVDQDAAYRQPFFLNSMPYEPNKERGPGEAFWSYYPIESPIMARFLDDGEIALGFFNFSDDKRTGWFTLDNLELPITAGKTIEATDLWTGDVWRPEGGVFKFDWLEGHSCQIFRAKIVDMK